MIAATTSEDEAAAKAARIRDFVDRYAVWMNDVSIAAQKNPQHVGALVDLMKARLVADLDGFIEVELRLRAFARRTPDGDGALQLIGNAG